MIRYKKVYIYILYIYYIVNLGVGEGEIMLEKRLPNHSNDL
jgi:hypothetical protein